MVRSHGRFIYSRREYSHCIVADAGNLFLLTAKNQTGGVELRIYPDADGDAKWPSYGQREVGGTLLSPECGDGFRRCDQLLIIADAALGSGETSASSPSTFVVILPLQKSLGMIKIKFADTGFPYSEEPHKIDVSVKYNCSPTASYSIHGSCYTICINSDARSIRLLRLKLNATNLEKSSVSDVEAFNFDGNLTNTLYVDLPSRSGPVIFFATEYHIFYFKPLLGLIAELNVGLRDWECSATTIDYIGDWEMIVYCENEQAVYVDINSESIFYAVQYGKEGRPYACPNPDIYLAVTAQYVTYAHRSTNLVTDSILPGRDFEDGICFGTENTTLFAFTDRVNGTQVFNGSSFKMLSSRGCTNYPCLPLVVLRDRYLAIREKRKGSWYISIFDSHNHFSPALEAKHGSADLMALIEGVKRNKIEVTSPKQANEEERQEQENGPSTATILAAALTAVIASTVGVILILGGLIYTKRKKYAYVHKTYNYVLLYDIVCVHTLQAKG